MRTSCEWIPEDIATILDTRSSEIVERRVAQAYWNLYPNGNQQFVPWAFRLVLNCFEGRYPGYQAIDARYHDWEHTLQGTLAFAILLEGRAQSGATPVIHQELGELGILAILLHDTGYLKRSDDLGGTGAKYTMTHVNRSCDFAEMILRENGFSTRQYQSVQHMIRCTGVGQKIEAIPFQSEEEKILGLALGTGDLLGQMAAPDYLEKLPILYDEFLESAQFNEGRGGPPLAFHSVADLCAKTPLFWRHYVCAKIEKEFAGLYRYLERPTPMGWNVYMEAIQANIDRLERQLAAVA